MQKIIVGKYCSTKKRGNNEKCVWFLWFNYFFAIIKNCLPKIVHRDGNLKNKETINSGRSFIRTIL